MRSLLYGVLFLTFLGCGQSSGDAAETATTTETATTATTATPDTAATATTASAAPAGQESNMSAYENKVVELHTSAGQINIRFFPDVAPNHVKNFIDLAQRGFYDGTKFHRVIPGFVIQGGDPNTKSGDPSTWGTGGAATNVKAEFNPVPHKRGIVSMARSGHPDSASSLFFICVADVPNLDNQYTVFGQVTKGMEVVDTIVSAPRGAYDRPNNPTTITKAVV
ncbi:MAG: peptidylprolyl isomerase, partial [Thermoanaerobaculia bacterium]